MVTVLQNASRSFCPFPDYIPSRFSFLSLFIFFLFYIMFLYCVLLVFNSFFYNSLIENTSEQASHISINHKTVSKSPPTLNSIESNPVVFPYLTTLTPTVFLPLSLFVSLARTPCLLSLSLWNSNFPLFCEVIFSVYANGEEQSKNNKLHMHEK